MPAWLMNWLAEGKPMAFVRRLEEVAVKWDERALTMKSMPCKGRGFGESSPGSFGMAYCLSGPGAFVLFGLSSVQMKLRRTPRIAEDRSRLCSRY